jgi:hypothetical protein
MWFIKVGMSLCDQSPGMLTSTEGMGSVYYKKLLYF